MERREKRALAFLLAASLLCLALVGLAAGDPPAERAEALFRAGREEFDRAAAELLAGNGPAELPRGVTEAGGWAPPPAIGGSAMCPQTS